MRVNVLNHFDENYPKRLSSLSFTSDIYYRGNLNQEKPTLGIIGTRRPTPYGLFVVKSFLSDFKGLKLNVVSGLALGVDSYAHRQALENDINTLAVIPTSVGSVYPKSHIGLAEQIVNSGGAVVSNQKQLESPSKYHFYERNHLLAALCDAVLVVEASERSGTMITVNYALEFGKSVMAVPGRIDSPMSRGVNKLLSQGATPVISSESVLNELGLTFNDKEITLTKAETKIVELVDKGIDTVDELSEKSSLDPAEFNMILTELEMKQAIQIEAAKIFLCL